MHLRDSLEELFLLSKVLEGRGLDKAELNLEIMFSTKKIYECIAVYTYIL